MFDKNFKNFLLILLILKFGIENIKATVLQNQISQITTSTDLESIDPTKITDAEKDIFLAKLESFILPLSASYITKVKNTTSLNLTKQRIDLLGLISDVKNKTKTLENFVSSMSFEDSTSPNYINVFIIDKIQQDKTSSTLTSDLLNKINENKTLKFTNSQRNILLKILMDKQFEEKISSQNDAQNLNKELDTFIGLADQLSTSLTGTPDQALQGKIINIIKVKKSIINDSTLKNLITNSKLSLIDPYLDPLLKDIIKKSFPTISNTADIGFIYNAIQRLSTPLTQSEKDLKDRIVSTIQSRKSLINITLLKLFRNSIKLALSDEQKAIIDKLITEKEETAKAATKKTAAETKVTSTPATTKTTQTSTATTKTTTTQQDKTQTTQAKTTTQTTPKTTTTATTKTTAATTGTTSATTTKKAITVADILSDIAKMQTQDDYLKALAKILTLTTIPAELSGVNPDNNKYLNKIYQNADVLSEAFINTYKNNAKMKFTEDEKGEIYLTFFIKKAKTQSNLLDIVTSKIKGVSTKVIDKFKEMFYQKTLELKDLLDIRFIKNCKNYSKFNFKKDLQKTKSLDDIILAKKNALNDLNAEIEKAKDASDMRAVLDKLLKNNDITGKSHIQVERIIENFLQKTLKIVSLNSTEDLAGIKDNNVLTLLDDSLDDKYNALISFWIELKDSGINLKDLIREIEDAVNKGLDKNDKKIQNPEITELLKYLISTIEIKIDNVAQGAQAEELKNMLKKIKL